MDGVHSFWLCFLPLFAALNPISIVPTFSALVDGLEPRQTRRLIAQSMATATLVSVAFLAGGKALFMVLGIGVADFMVAGGLLLFIISLQEITAGADRRPTGQDDNTLGAVPIGVPLIVGPATLTTSLLLIDQHGIGPTLTALAVNLGLVTATLLFAARIRRALSRSGTKALSKISYLLLAAIAVKIVRHGLEMLLETAGP